jgi:two-component system, LytTR family, response regulator
MNKYNAIIIDDELNVRQGLAFMVRMICPEIELCGLAESAETGRRLLKEKDIQLIFLDISMPNENGFDFIKSIRKENYAIIFTTAFEEYALKAIKASAIDYLLKPINQDELVEAVAKAVKYLELRATKSDAQNVYKQSLENFAEQISNGNITRITVTEEYGFRIVEINTIRYLEADINYTVIHLVGYDKVTTSKSIGEFEKILDLPLFFRIHKSAIVNLNFLKSYSNYQGHFAILDDNFKLPISRRRINEFRDAVNKFSKSVNL